MREDALQQPRPQTKTIVLPRPAPEPDEKGKRSFAQEPRTGKDREADAVFVPTPRDMVEKMLQLADVKEHDVVYDLGCGDGRIVIAAAKKYGCKAVGYEIDPDLAKLARENVAKNKMQSLVRIEYEDILTCDLSGASVVTAFLSPRLMERLLPQLEKLKPGSRIVSHQFEIPGVPAEKVLDLDSQDDGNRHRLLLWTIPLRKAPSKKL